MIFSVKKGSALTAGLFFIPWRIRIEAAKAAICAATLQLRRKTSYLAIQRDKEFLNVPDTIVCISCVKSKRQSPCAAKDMYISPLFRGMFQYAQNRRPAKIFILSAEYGLLKPDDIIAPYEKTLKKMKVSERAEWARKVLEKLQQETDLQADHFVFLAGTPYRENLIPHIAHYEVPMEGLPFGKQLQWLTEKATA